MNVDDRIKDLLQPLREEHRRMLEAKADLQEKIDAVAEDIKKIERVMRAADVGPAKRPLPLKKKVSDKKADYALLMIEEHIEDRETAFTSGELQQWANISQSTAGEILRVLRNREKIRLIGRVRADGQMGQAPYGYQLMP